MSEQWTCELFKDARGAEVKRIAHISVNEPSSTSPLPYFRAKALLERELINSEVSYAILQPTVIFGTEDILINNIAWLLRHFRIFPIFSSGSYHL